MFRDKNAGNLLFLALSLCTTLSLQEENMGLSFKVKIINFSFPAKPEQYAGCDKYERTACVSTYVNGSYIGTRLYGYFDYIKHKNRFSGGKLNLNHAFIDNFNMANISRSLCVTAANSFWNSKSDFSGCYFDGDTDFKDSVFAGSVLFTETVFNGNASFAGCTFAGTSNFGSSIFKGEADFKEAHFTNNVNFSRADFAQSFNISHAEFTGEAEFKYAKIYLLLDMSQIKSSSVLHLTRVHCSTISLHGAVLGTHTDISPGQCSHIMLNSCRTGGCLILNLNTNLKSLSICDIASEGRIDVRTAFPSVKRAISRSVYFDFPEGRGRMPCIRMCSFGQIAEQFNTLKQIYCASGRYDWEDMAYVEFRRNKRKTMPSPVSLLKNKSIGSRDMIKALLSWFISKPLEYICLDVFGGYGTRPLRTMCGIIAAILIFSFIYSLPAFAFIYMSASELNLADYLYISGTAFFTIGFGDIIPANTTTKLLTIAEGFTGVFLMSYFTVSFARRTLR